MLFSNEIGRHVVVYKPDHEKMDYDGIIGYWSGDYYETMRRFNWDLARMLKYTTKFKEFVFSDVGYGFNDIFNEVSSYKDDEWKTDICYGDLISIDDIFYFVDQNDNSVVELGKVRKKVCI